MRKISWLPCIAFIPQGEAFQWEKTHGIAALIVLFIASWPWIITHFNWCIHSTSGQWLLIYELLRWWKMPIHHANKQLSIVISWRGNSQFGQKGAALYCILLFSSFSNDMYQLLLHTDTLKTESDVIEEPFFFSSTTFFSQGSLKINFNNHMNSCFKIQYILLSVLDISFHLFIPTNLVLHIYLLVMSFKGSFKKHNFPESIRDRIVYFLLTPS